METQERTSPTRGPAPKRRQRRALRFERLESRRLMAVSIHEFPLPTASSNPEAIVAGSDGNLYFTGGQTNVLDPSLGQTGLFLGQINPGSHVVAEFPIPIGTGSINGIASGPDGDVSFTVFGLPAEEGFIGQFDPTTHAFAVFPDPGYTPVAITAGSDGSLWFTELGDAIGQINPTTHAITQFSVPVTASAELSDITAGSDGNLWFTESGPTSQIGELNPTSHAVNMLSVGTYVAIAGAVFQASYVGGITPGPDGNLWFTGDTQTITVVPEASVSTVGFVGELNAATHAITLFPLTTGNLFGVNTNSAITAGSDGNLWFTESSGEIGQFNPVTHVVAQFPLLTAQSHPVGITSGADGNIWFTDPGSNQVGSTGIGDGPTVLNLQRFGIHAQLTRLVLTFDNPLDPASAVDANNYRIVDPHGHSIRVVKAVYNPSAKTVTLDPRRRLNIHKAYTLIVNGTTRTGVTDVSGKLLDGAGTGQPGSNCVVIVNRSRLVLPDPKRVSRPRR